MAEENGLVTPDETEVMLAVLDSSDKIVGEIMTPIGNVVSLTANATIGQAIQNFRYTGSAEFPF